VAGSVLPRESMSYGIRGGVSDFTRDLLRIPIQVQVQKSFDLPVHLMFAVFLCFPPDPFQYLRCIQVLLRGDHAD